MQKNNTIYILDDYEIIREGLKLYFNKTRKYKVIGSADYQKTALEEIASSSPAFVLLD